MRLIVQLPKKWMVRAGKARRSTGARSNSIVSLPADEGKYFAGCIMAAFLGQLDCEELEVADLLGGHCLWDGRISFSSPMPIVWPEPRVGGNRYSCSSSFFPFFGLSDAKPKQPGCPIAYP